VTKLKSFAHVKSKADKNKSSWRETSRDADIKAYTWWAKKTRLFIESL